MAVPEGCQTTVLQCRSGLSGNRHGTQDARWKGEGHRYFRGWDVYLKLKIPYRRTKYITEVLDLLIVKESCLDSFGHDRFSHTVLAVISKCSNPTMDARRGAHAANHWSLSGGRERESRSKSESTNWSDARVFS